MAEMTYNEALQEITRFQNIWRGTSLLKETLQAAVGLEAEVNAMTQTRDALAEGIAEAQSRSEATLSQIKEKVELAESEHRDRMLTLNADHEQWEKSRALELAGIQTQREQEVAAFMIRHQQRQQELTLEIEALNQEIADKHTIIQELNVELETLRQRLG